MPCSTLRCLPYGWLRLHCTVRREPARISDLEPLSEPSHFRAPRAPSSRLPACIALQVERSARDAELSTRAAVGRQACDGVEIERPDEMPVVGSGGSEHPTAARENHLKGGNFEGRFLDILLPTYSGSGRASREVWWAAVNLVKIA